MEALRLSLLLFALVQALIAEFPESALTRTPPLRRVLSLCDALLDTQHV